MKRFQRQIILPQVKSVGQDSIAKARVLLVGAGGLGTPAAQYLVAAGVGHLTIFDGDHVQESNLHRQTQFDPSDIGKNKAVVLAERISRLNPDCVIEAVPAFLDKSMAVEHFPNFDVIIDGTDNFSSKFLVNDIAAIYGKPVVFGAISQFEGQVSVFWRGHGPCYRCLFPNPPKTKIQNCAEAGVLGPLPGIIGAMQAMECLKVILYKRDSSATSPLLGRLATFDFSSNSFHSYQVRKRSGCACSTDGYRIDAVADIRIEGCELPAVGVDSGYVEIPSASKNRAKLIDVRTTPEWDDFHIDGSIHWPFDRIENGEFPELADEFDYFCVCLSGTRARKAEGIFRDNGFKNVNYLTGSVYEYSAGR